MSKVNKIIFVLINIIWGIAVVISGFFHLRGISSFVHFLNTIVLFFVAFFQFYGGVKLWKGNMIIPIIATCFFLISIDLEGFKFVTTTFCYLLLEINTSGATINGTVMGDPTILINLSFSPITFNRIAFNILAVVQVGLLLYEYDLPDELEEAQVPQAD